MPQEPPALSQGPHRVPMPWEARNAPERGATLTRILVRISRGALQEAHLESILQGICECLVAELPVAIASVILLDQANANFVHEVYAGEMTTSPLVADGCWPVGVGVAGRCVRSGKPQLVGNVRADPDYVAGNARACSEYVVPIRHGRRLHGVLNLESERTDFFNQETMAVFDAVADLVAGAIHFARVAGELQQANRKLEELSMIDGLTGIGNRRRFDRQLKEEWVRMARQRRPLALLIIDADAFKALNDACGHLYGDECLRELARLCSGFAGDRAGLAARFGGEELVLLLPGHDLDAAMQVAEDVRAAVVARGLIHPQSPVANHVTVSIGAAAWVPDAARPPERLVACADRALYAAKLQGRNRTQGQTEE